MPMMRRGPLARYNAEWVLRQARASATSGSIEFHTDRPLTLYLRNGRVSHAVEGVAETGLADDADAVPADEAAARSRVVALVTVAMTATDGWYYLDPIGHHSVATPWDWDASSLILDGRIHRRATENRAAAPAATRPVPASPATAPPTALDPTAAPDPAPDAATPPPLPERLVELVAPEDQPWITLSAEAWRIACALAGARASGDLRDQLGWSAPRLDTALRELAAAGVLAPDPTEAPATTPTAGDEAAAANEPVATRPAAVAAVPVPVDEAPPATAPTPVAARVEVEAPAPVPAATEPAALPPTVAPIPGSRPKPGVDRRSALRRLISNLRPA